MPRKNGRKKGNPKPEKITTPSGKNRTFPGGVPPSNEKRLHGDAAAENYRTMAFRWTLKHADLGTDKYGYGSISGNVLLPRVLTPLENFSTMTWEAIRTKKSCHPSSIESVEPFARDIINARRDDWLSDHTLYQLSVDGTGRIWGYRQHDIFIVKWWDPDHEWDPSQLRNT